MIDKIETVIGDYTVTVRFRDWKDKGYQAKTRVYGAMDLVPELLSDEPHTDKNIPFKVSREDFDLESDFEAMVAAKKEYASWKRATTKAAKAKMLPIVGEFLAIHKFMHLSNIATLNAEFSRTAGCSCPCSPGFILTSRLTDLDHRPFDLWIDLTEDLKVERQKAEERRYQKASQEEAKKIGEARKILEDAGYTVSE